MGTNDNAAANTAAKISTSAGTGFGNNPGGEFATTPASSSSGLSGSVGIGGANAPGDVFQVSSALTSNGLMEAPQENADSILYSGIISAQENMDSSLKRDGLVNPEGPTQQKYSRLAGQSFVKAPAPAAPPPPLPEKPAGLTQPATGDAAANAAITARTKQQAIKTAEAKSLEHMGDVTRTGFQQNQDVKRVQKAKADAQRATQRAQELEVNRREKDQKAQLKIVNQARSDTQKQSSQQANLLAHKLGQSIGQTLKSVLLQVPQNPSPPTEGERQGEGIKITPQLSEDVIQSNQRLATALTRRAGVGDLPRFTKDAINTDATKAIPEIIDLIREVETSDPKQARELYELTLEGITPENQLQLEKTYTLSASNREEDKQPSLEEGVDDVFGLEKDIERPKGMLPMPDKIDPDGKGVENIDWSNWTAPEWVHEGAKAVTLPKHVLDGGKWSPDDVTKAALAASAGSSVSSVPAGALRSGVTRLRGTPKFMRKVDLEKQGQDAAKQAMDNKTSVPQAMFREDVGEITFDYGSPKLGLEHIRSGRMQKDGMSEEEAMEFIQKKVPEVLAHGNLKKLKDRYGHRRAEITHNNSRVILALDRTGKRETYIITGYEDW